MADTVSINDLPSTFLEQVKGLVGPKGWSTDPDEIGPHLDDWRGRIRGTTPLLVKPASTDEVSRVVKLCSKYTVAITPQGGNTGLVDGGIPHGEILLSLKRMNSIRSVDPLNNSMIVDAGTILQSVHDAADAEHRLFPLSLGSQGICTIGGLISTNAGGVAVLRYGMMRDLVLGLEVVLPNGDVINGLRGLRKDNTGYDLRHLFCGAEGTLGVVTGAELKLFPKPSVATGWLIVETAQNTVDLLSRFRSIIGDTVTSFELIPKNAVDMVTNDIADTRDPLPSEAPWRILIEVSMASDEAARTGLEEALETGLEEGLIADAALATSVEQSNAFWKIRESIPLSKRAYGTSVNHDISAKTSSVPGLLDELKTKVARIAPAAEIVAFGHLGDGNIHYGVAEPATAEQPTLSDKADEIMKLVHETTVRRGGSVSAEHGIGRLKLADLAIQKSAAELALMKAIKQAIDPQNIMNPGRVIPL